MFCLSEFKFILEFFKIIDSLRVFDKISFLLLTWSFQIIFLKLLIQTNTFIINNNFILFLILLIFVILFRLMIFLVWKVAVIAAAAMALILSIRVISFTSICHWTWQIRSIHIIDWGTSALNLTLSSLKNEIFT